MPPNIDDPRLTAYALGELAGPEYADDRAEMRQLVARDPEARRFVDELRATAATLRGELAMEIAPGLDEARRSAILSKEAAEQFELIAPSPSALRLRRDDDVDDAEGRDDVYHVITHPAPEPRRYRTNLIAVAAAVAIVTTTVTVLVTSLFRNLGIWNGQPVASTTTTAPANVGTTPRTPGGNGPTVPEVADGFNGKSPRELFAVMASPEPPRQPFGVAVSLDTSKLTTKAPTTNPAGQGNNAASVTYALSFENPFFEASHNPLSTFAFNVGGTSLPAVRAAVANHRLPDRASVRIEEMVNAFAYQYEAPKNNEDAFASNIEVADCPWSAGHRLVRIGLRARDLQGREKDHLVSDDLRIRVEFNPALVTAYRLIGYDRKYVSQSSAEPEQPSQVRSGQAVTALYEVVPVGQKIGADEDPLAYQKTELTSRARTSREMLTVTLKYTDLQNDPARFQGRHTQQFAVMDKGTALPQASSDFKLAAAVAGFGMILRDSPHKGSASYETMLALANQASAKDPAAASERAQFVQLVQQARQIRG
jgi:hypothetical protein